MSRVIIHCPCGGGAASRDQDRAFFPYGVRCLGCSRRLLHKEDRFEDKAPPRSVHLERMRGIPLHFKMAATAWRRYGLLGESLHQFWTELIHEAP